MKHVVFAVPGSLDTPTGGYAYDRRMIAELRELGWRPEVLGLGDGFPRPNALTKAAAKAHLTDVPKGRPIVIDGLWGLQWGNGGSGGDADRSLEQISEGAARKIRTC